MAEPGKKRSLVAKALIGLFFAAIFALALWAAMSGVDIRP